MKWYHWTLALTTAGVATAVFHRIIAPASGGNSPHILRFGPSPDPNILFLPGITNWRLPRVMKLDDLMNGDFVLTIVNLGLRSAKPYVSVTERGYPATRYLVADDRPLDYHKVREIARWARPPTLRRFLELFNITPKPAVIIEFGSGHWIGEAFTRNDRIWWQVNIEGI